jgi:hypothetical protein
LTLKIYTKGERVLRIEAVAHDTAELKCGRSLGVDAGINDSNSAGDVVKKASGLAPWGTPKTGQL